LKRIAGFIYDHSRLIMAFVVIINLVSLASFYKFNLDTDFLAFFSKGNPRADEYIQLNARYYSGETVSVLVESDHSLLNKENLLDIFELQKRMAAIYGVTRVQSFIPPEVMADSGITRVDNVYIEEQYPSLRDYIENDYFFTEQFLTEDSLSAIIIVSLKMDARADKVVDSLKELAEDSPLNLSLAGNEVINALRYWL